MKNKGLLAVLFILLLWIFYYFYIYSLKISFVNLSEIENPMIIGVVLLAIILGVSLVAPNIKELNFMQKPLWGFRKEGDQYTDTSLEKHPRFTYFLLFFVFILFIWSFFSFKYGSDPHTENITFSVYQDTRDNLKLEKLLVDVDFPLDREEVCLIAKDACGSSKCQVILDKEQINEIPADFSPSLGEFNWLVNLEPVCGPTNAFINEADRTVLCFCAYE